MTVSQHDHETGPGNSILIVFFTPLPFPPVTCTCTCSLQNMAVCLHKWVTWIGASGTLLDSHKSGVTPEESRYPNLPANQLHRLSRAATCRNDHQCRHPVDEELELFIDVLLSQHLCITLNRTQTLWLPDRPQNTNNRIWLHRAWYSSRGAFKYTHTHTNNNWLPLCCLRV